MSGSTEQEHSPQKGALNYLWGPVGNDVKESRKNFLEQIEKILGKELTELQEKMRHAYSIDELKELLRSFSNLNGALVLANEESIALDQAIFKWETADLKTGAPAHPEDTFRMVKVAFGTDRNMTFKSSFDKDFCPDDYEVEVRYERSCGIFFENGRPKLTSETLDISSLSELYFGTVTALIPESDLHPIEKKGGGEIYKGSCKSLQLGGISLFETIPKVVESLSLSSEKNMLVFIHGFDNTFADAAKSAARLQLGVGIPTAFFSWPSAGSFRAYPHDEATVETSERGLLKFLLGFLRTIKNGKVHVIAHSMGNRCLLRALQRMQKDKLQRKQEEEPPLKLGHVVFIAADVDSQLFVDLADDGFEDVADKVTLYCSSHDKALLGSANVIHGSPRCGRHPPYTVGSRFTTIAADDATPGFMGHGYFTASQAVLRNFRSMMKDRVENRLSTKFENESFRVYEVKECGNDEQDEAQNEVAN